MLASIAAAQCIAYAQQRRADIEYAMRALAPYTPREPLMNPDDRAYPEPTQADHIDAMCNGPDRWLWTHFEFGRTASLERTIARYVAVLDHLPAEFTCQQFSDAGGFGQRGGYYAINTLIKHGYAERIGSRPDRAFYYRTVRPETERSV